MDAINGRRARLGRDVPVRLVNVSRAGFLVECHQPIPEHSTGELHVPLRGVPARDRVQIGRVVGRIGCGKAYALGGRFVDERPAPNSVRTVLSEAK